jgi:hypothetical protein
MGKAHSKRLSIRPDGPRPAPGQIILIHHGAIQKPQWVQHIEGEIGDDPWHRGKILPQVLALAATLDVGCVVNVRVQALPLRNKTATIDFKKS